MASGAPPLEPLEESLGSLHIRLILSRREIINPKWDHASYCSPFWRLYAHTSRGAAIRTASGTLQMAPSLLILIPAWLAFETRVPRSGRPIWQSYLHFECAGLPPVLQRRFFPSPIVLPANAALAAMTRRWRRSLERPEPGLADWFWAQALAEGALAAALESLPPALQDEHLAWLRRTGALGGVLHHIDRRLDAPPANAELAALCHMSPDHFVRTFRRAFGVTPQQYGIERRIAAAAEWLAQTNRSLDDIAASAGFTDRFHFTRSFRSRIGLPPATYRRLLRAAPPDAVSGRC